MCQMGARVLVLVAALCSSALSSAPRSLDAATAWGTDELSLLQLGGEKNAQTVAKNAGNIAANSAKIDKLMGGEGKATDSAQQQASTTESAAAAGSEANGADVAANSGNIEANSAKLDKLEAKAAEEDAAKDGTKAAQNGKAAEEDRKQTTNSGATVSKSKPTDRGHKYLTPEQANHLVEKYTRQAESAIRAVPEEKRQKVSEKTVKAVGHIAIYSAQKVRDEQEARASKREFRKEGLPQKVLAIERKTMIVEAKEKSMAKFMSKAWKDEQRKKESFEIRSKALQVEIVQRRQKQYVALKEKLQVDTSFKIGEYQKKTMKYQGKVAEETARYNRLASQLRKKKALLAEKSAKELKHKEETAEVNAKARKGKEKLQKSKKKLADEVLSEKVIKATKEAKNKEEASADSPETVKAEKALRKVNGNLHIIEKDVATEMADASKDAVRSQDLMLKAQAASDVTTNETADVNFTFPDFNYTAVNRKKCGPGVLCTVYDEVVKRAGGTTKYLKLDKAEQAKLKGKAKEVTDEMKRQAFDVLAKRFGVTGEATEGKFCGANIPCTGYNKVKEAVGDNAKFLKELADVEQKMLAKEAKNAPKGEVKKKPKLTIEMKQAAFDKVRDMHGVVLDAAEKPQPVEKPESEPEVPAETPSRLDVMRVTSSR